MLQINLEISKQEQRIINQKLMYFDLGQLHAISFNFKSMIKTSFVLIYLQLKYSSYTYFRVDQSFIQYFKRYLILPFMESSGTPDPRFKQFEERFNGKGVAVGFTLPGNTFFFQYDEQGGWRDQKGRYYNSDGVLNEQDDFQQQQDQEEILGEDDEEIIDQFQQMLIEEEQGIVHKKPQKKKQQGPKEVHPQSGQFNFQQQTLKLLQKYKLKQQTREGLPAQVFIYFKMRSKYFQRTKPQVQKGQSGADKNKIITSIKETIQKKRQELIKLNPWLGDNFVLDYSGSSVEQGAYDRYWYGIVKVCHQKYSQVIEGLKKSNEFALLKSKTYYAFKSKFYLKKSMKQTIQKLKAQLKDIPQQNAIRVSLNNLPQQFSLSTVIDLIDISGGFVQDIEDIDIIDEFKAEAIVKKRTALKLANIEGYCHDFKQYIWLQFKNEERLAKSGNMYNIEVDSEFKIYDRETGDTLAMLRSAKQLAKAYQIKDKFRFVIGEDALRRILMYRGESINVVRMVLFQNK